MCSFGKIFTTKHFNDVEDKLEIRDNFLLKLNF